MARPQANVSLSAEEYDVLVALAFVEETSASEVLRPVVTEFLDSQAGTPEVRQALDALHARRAREAGKLTGLPEHLRKDAEATPR